MRAAAARGVSLSAAVAARTSATASASSGLSRATAAALVARPVAVAASLTAKRSLVAAASSAAGRNAREKDNGPSRKLLETIKAEIQDATEEGAGEEDEELTKTLSKFKVTENGEEAAITVDGPVGAHGWNVRVTFKPNEYEQVEDSEGTYEKLPVRLTVSKGDHAITFEGAVFRPEVSEDGDSDDEEVPFLSPQKMFLGKDDKYTPIFDELNETLQDEVGEWLAFNGLDEDFFHMLCDLAAVKEEDLYYGWIQKLKSTVEGFEKA